MDRNEKRPPEHENLERWMVSYADFMTLLFALFVVLYAFAMAKQSDAKSIAESIAQAFTEASVVNSPGGALLVPGSMASKLSEDVQEAVKAQLDANQGDTGKQIIEDGGVMMNFQTTSTVSNENRDDTTSGSDDERDGQNNSDSATSAGELVISENTVSNNQNPNLIILMVVLKPVMVVSRLVEVLINLKTAVEPMWMLTLRLKVRLELILMP